MRHECNNLSRYGLISSLFQKLKFQNLALWKKMVKEEAWNTILVKKKDFDHSICTFEKNNQFVFSYQLGGRKKQKTASLPDSKF